MSNEQMYARHSLKMEYVKKYLQELNIETKYEKRSKDLPVETIFAQATREDKESNLYINFSFIPVSGDIVYTMDLLQFFNFFDYNVAPERKNTIIKLLDAINLRTMIGSFFLLDDKIVFKYVYMVPSYQILQEDSFKECVMLFVYAYDMFYDIIKAVNSGKIGLGEALDKLNNV